MDDVFFSVIIPIYNREKYILKAVESIFNQTFNNWELILINDASSDATAAIINEINNPKVVVIHNAHNLERCVSRNIGIKAAKGKYICFLDSDDYHLPNHLELLHSFIEAQGEPVALFFTNAYNESAEGVRSERLCPSFEQFNPYTYFLTYTVNPQRWAVHRQIFTHVNFDPEVTICEDMDTSLRMIAAGYKAFQLKERTAVYVAAPDSFTHGDSKKAEKELYYLNKIFAKEELKNNLPLIPMWRLISMCHYHLAYQSQQKGYIIKMYQHILLSFLYFPKGYNGKTNLPMLVMFLYELPVVGKLLKSLRRKL